jgi:EcoRII C terminal
MKKGYLSAYFAGVAAKTLSAVEASPARSHQHEFNGSNALITLLGMARKQKHRYPARFLYLSEDGDEPVAEDSAVTWYDARAHSATRTGRTEHRLYFPTNEVTSRAQESDLLLIAKRQDGPLLVIIAEHESTIAAQLHWLFGLSDLARPGFSVRAEFETEHDRLGIAASVILEQIGVEADLSDERYLQAMLEAFGEGFPPTRVFSAYARSTVRSIDPVVDPDGALMAWMNREEVLFRTLEKRLIGARLRTGFLRDDDPDVDGFIGYSLSVQNRRKARAGAALENHLEAVFTALDITFERGAVTERNNRPDFLFPGNDEYHDPEFPPARLTMLAAKTTAKDRWRQVTKEADRIGVKHLLTLEPAISVKQTDQMRESGVQLIVPGPIHGEYTPAQCEWLLNLGGFIELVRGREVARGTVQVAASLSNDKR